MTNWKLLWVLGLFAFPGCAYNLGPLPGEHPANPDAVVGLERPFPKTLSYGPSDLPSPRPVSAVPMPEEGEVGLSQNQESSQETVVGEGRVIAVVASSGQLVVEHGEIQGFMDAMTMGYRVDPISLLEGLNAGDQIQFTIDVGKKAIVKIVKHPR